MQPLLPYVWTLKHTSTCWGLPVYTPALLCKASFLQENCIHQILQQYQSVSTAVTKVWASHQLWALAYAGMGWCTLELGGSSGVTGHVWMRVSSSM